MTFYFFIFVSDHVSMRAHARERGNENIYISVVYSNLKHNSRFLQNIFLLSSYYHGNKDSESGEYREYIIKTKCCFNNCCFINRENMISISKDYVRDRARIWSFLRYSPPRLVFELGFVQRAREKFTKNFHQPSRCARAHDRASIENKYADRRTLRQR